MHSLNSFIFIVTMLICKTKTLSLRRISNSAINTLKINPYKRTTSLFSTIDANTITSNISLKADQIRKLKDSKADKEVISREISVLLKLKEDYKQLTGNAFDPVKEKKSKISEYKDNDKDNGDKLGSKEENFVITPRITDYSAW